jgi:hypothetical protein
VVVRLLVLVGAQPAKLTLDAVGVVPAVDVAEQVQLGLLAGAVAGAVDPLDLQDREEVLRQRVVEAVADRAIDGWMPASVRRWVKRIAVYCLGSRGRRNTACC